MASIKLNRLQRSCNYSCISRSTTHELSQINYYAEPPTVYKRMPLSVAFPFIYTLPTGLLNPHYSFRRHGGTKNKPTYNSSYTLTKNSSSSASFTSYSQGSVKKCLSSKRKTSKLINNQKELWSENYSTADDFFNVNFNKKKRSEMYTILPNYDDTDNEKALSSTL